MVIYYVIKIFLFKENKTIMESLELLAYEILKQCETEAI
jgi:hypothetical protein